jgi:O-antigen chain-terminating methyltransferase
MTQPIDVQAIMRDIAGRIQERMRAPAKAATARSPSEVVDWASLEQATGTLQRTSLRVGELPPQPPTLRGRIGALLIRLVRRGLIWYTREIIAFQEVASRTLKIQTLAIRATATAGQRALTELEVVSSQVNQLRSDADRTEHQIAGLLGVQATIEVLASEVSALRASLKELGDQSVWVKRTLEIQSAINTQVSQDLQAETQARENLTAAAERADLRHLELHSVVLDQDRRISLLLKRTRRSFPELPEHEPNTVVPAKPDGVPDTVYCSFEDRFRGTRSEIKHRLETYLPYLETHGIGREQMPIVDVGCGRGEWLELLAERNLKSRGVDLNHVFLAQCKERGLPVIETDLLQYLEDLPSQSLGAVTGFHVIEHLPIDVLVNVFCQTRRVLKPGGLAIFETPNPQNILVATHNFYLDFTHYNPLPSLTVQFLLEACGLCDVQILYLHPYPEAMQLPDDGTELTKRFNEYFYGPQDYAVIGRQV